MLDRNDLERQVRDALATETQAVSLSAKLFGTNGLFSRLGDTEAERRKVVSSPLFRQAQKRFRELQMQEAAVFAKAVADVPAGHIVKMEPAKQAI